MLLRDANAGDFSAILALNHASVHVLSPLDAGRLEDLHRQAAWHRVVEIDGNVAAFVLVFRDGAAYDSPNYRWFAANCSNFVYVDRIVVSTAYQGRGIGPLLYDELFAFARNVQAELVTCEFDADPPNEASRRFHERYGFRELGRQVVGANHKTVSLQGVRLPILAGPL